GSVLVGSRCAMVGVDVGGGNEDERSAPLARAATARRTWPGWRETSITTSHPARATSREAPGPARSARVKAAPGGTAPDPPGARRVTGCARSTAAAAMQRPDQAV